MKLNRKSLLKILGVDEKKLEERIRIDLSNQNITQIDEETFRDLKKMESINFSGNKISKLGERSLEGLENVFDSMDKIFPHFTPDEINSIKSKINDLNPQNEEEKKIIQNILDLYLSPLRKPFKYK